MLRLKPLAWSGVRNGAQDGMSDVRNGAQDGMSDVKSGALDGTNDVRSGAQAQIPPPVQPPAQLNNSTGSAPIAARKITVPTSVGCYQELVSTTYRLRRLSSPGGAGSLVHCSRSWLLRLARANNAVRSPVRRNIRASFVSVGGFGAE